MHMPGSRKTRVKRLKAGGETGTPAERGASRCCEDGETGRENAMNSAKEAAISSPPPDITASLETLDRLLAEFTQSNKTQFAELFHDLSAVLLGNSLGCNDGYRLTCKLIQISDTPYFHFFSDCMYAFCVKMLSKAVRQSNQTKISVYEHLLAAYDPVVLFVDLAALYNEIDNFHVGHAMFKNYALYKILERQLRRQVEEEKHRDACLYLLSLCPCMESCPGFVDFLAKSPQSFPARSLMFTYVYHWLGRIPVDLLRVQSSAGVKDIECRAMSRIFTVFWDLRRAFKSTTRDQDGAAENRPGGGKDSAPRRESAFEAFLLRFLFKHDDIGCIAASLYRRLTFFFLLQNKRLFGTARMLRVFSRADIRKIYKSIRSCKAAFVNVFGQLDRRYIVRELSRTLDLQIFKETDPLHLDSAGLARYYEAYLKILERERPEGLAVAVTDLELFSRVANACVDKAFMPYVVIRLDKDPQRVETETARMLVYYSAHFKCTFLDVVFLCSVLLDSKNAPLRQQNTLYYNDILTILYNISSTIGPALRKRLAPLVRKLLCYDDYVLRAGMLCAALGVPSAESCPISDIRVLASLNHPSFAAAIAEAGSSDVEIETATLYYIHHNPSYAASATDVLLSILQRADSNTSLLLDYLERLPPDASFQFSFISENISVFYSLFDSHRQVLSIFIKSLRSKAVLPCMVMPHILCGTNCDYVFRMYTETALNCIPDALYMVTARIRAALHNRSIETAREGFAAHEAAAYATQDLLDKRLDAVCSCIVAGRSHGPAQSGEASANEPCPTIRKLISRDDLKSIVDSELRVSFISDICNAVGARKVAKKIPPMSGVLMSFVILRQLKDLDRKSKETLFSALEENAQDEQVMELVNSSREFYKRASRGTIPVEYMLRLAGADSCDGP